MTLKMHQIVDLPIFFERIKSQKLPFKTSYKMTIFAQEVDKHIGFYQEKFRELLQQYGEKDAEGNLVPTDDGHGVRLAAETMQEAYEKVAELRDLEVELPEYKFNLELFENIELTPSEMSIILPFIEE